MADKQDEVTAKSLGETKSLSAVPSKRCEWCGNLATRFGGSPYMADPHDMCINCYEATRSGREDQVLPFELVERL